MPHAPTAPTLRHYPLGDAITGSPHSVAVSLPTRADVIAYEEHDPATRAALTSGYPRFIRHPLVQQVAACWASSWQVDATQIMPCPTAAVARDAVAFIGAEATARPAPAGTCWAVVLAHGGEALRRRAKAYWQHTGLGLTSREAEAWLLAQGQIAQAYPEDRAEGDFPALAQRVEAHLRTAAGWDASTPVFLTRGGMSAFYQVYQALQAIQAPQGRFRWVQLGWLYVDTDQVLQHWNGNPAATACFQRVHELSALEAYLEAHGPEVAGIVTEVPTNPLLQTPDVPRLRALADRAGCALVLDPSLVSPVQVDIRPWADVQVVSLTKYAAAAADAMLGAIAVSTGSRWAEALQEALPRYQLAPPATPDLARMAAQIDAYRANVQTLNQRAEAVRAYLEGHPWVERLYWSGQAGSDRHYQAIQRPDGGAGSVLSFTLKGADWGRFYDAVPVAKGPSFGAGFAILCPYIQLAHYALTQSPEGLAQLRQAGIAPGLLRYAVGLEPAEAQIAALEAGFRALYD